MNFFRRRATIGSAMLPPSLNPEEQRCLLALARRAIRAALEGRPVDSGLEMTELVSEQLRRPGMAFVTLYRGERLRGCVGSLRADKPVYLAVADSAISAALHDPRFARVTLDELDALTLEISLLSSFFPVEPEEVKLGEHGLLLSRGFQRGLLLPKVPVEHGWTRERFLEELCGKAGLELDAWKQGARLQAFTAFAFSEDD